MPCAPPLSYDDPRLAPARARPEAVFQVTKHDGTFLASVVDSARGGSGLTGGAVRARAVDIAMRSSCGVTARVRWSSFRHGVGASSSVG
jgi:hypothetical protein